jgi:hypothetical protein
VKVLALYEHTGREDIHIDRDSRATISLACWPSVISIGDGISTMRMPKPQRCRHLVADWSEYLSGQKVAFNAGELRHKYCE